MSQVCCVPGSRLRQCPTGLAEDLGEVNQVHVVFVLYMPLEQGPYLTFRLVQDGVHLSDTPHDGSLGLPPCPGKLVLFAQPGKAGRRRARLCVGLGLPCRPFGPVGLSLGAFQRAAARAGCGGLRPGHIRFQPALVQPGFLPWEQVPIRWRLR